jgi:UDP-glucuronate decarboxylase
MRILITGGAGFIGSHLTDKLLAANHEVLVADNLYTGSRKNFEHNLNNSNFEFIRHDVTMPLYVEVDAIFNLASPASPVHYQRFPVQTIKTNVIGSVNMLGLAKRLNIPIFQASTSEVYGDPSISPQTEEYWGNVNPIGVRSCYDEGKRAAESLFMDYHRQYSLPIRIFRIFNTYGPRMSLNDGRVISNFITQSLQGRPITIYGDGTQTRSFCYVDDLTHAFEEALLLDAPLIGPINLGNPNELSMLEVAKKIIEITNSKSEIEFKALPLDDPKQRKPDITKAKMILNWSPLVDLEVGLSRTVKDFEKRMNL